MRRRLAPAVLLLALSGCASLEGARLYTRGTEAMEAGRTDEAVADLEEAAARMPGSSPVQNHLGLAYARAGRDADALAAFRRAVQIDCSNEAAQRNLAAAQRRAGLRLEASAPESASSPGDPR